MIILKILPFDIELILGKNNMAKQQWWWIKIRHHLKFYVVENRVHDKLRYEPLETWHYEVHPKKEYQLHWGVSCEPLKVLQSQFELRPTVCINKEVSY